MNNYFKIFFLKPIFSIGLWAVFCKFSFANSDLTATLVNSYWSSNCNDPTSIVATFRRGHNNLQKIIYNGVLITYSNIHSTQTIDSQKVLFRYKTFTNSYTAAPEGRPRYDEGEEILEFTGVGYRLFSRRENGKDVVKDGKVIPSNLETPVLAKCPDDSIAVKMIEADGYYSHASSKNSASLYDDAIFGSERILSLKREAKKIMDKFSDRSIIIAKFTGRPVIRVNSDNETASLEIAFELDWDPGFKKDFELLLDAFFRARAIKEVRVETWLFDRIISCLGKYTIDAKIFQNGIPAWKLYRNSLDERQDIQRLNLHIRESAPDLNERVIRPPVAVNYGFGGSGDKSPRVGSKNVPIRILRGNAEVSIEILNLKTPSENQIYSCTF